MRESKDRPKVFVTRMLPGHVLKPLKKKAMVKVWKGADSPPKSVIVKEVVEAKGLLCMLTDTIDEEVLGAGRALKVVSQCATGYDNIDVSAASRHGVYVTNTPNVLTETVADLTWALILALARRIVQADGFVRRRRWRVGWSPTFIFGSDVHGKTLGIVGLGRIGEAVARRAKGFGMKILYSRRTRRLALERELGVEFVAISELLEQSDFVTLHLPLSEETRHMIGERELKAMRKTAYLINTSRGAIVDQKALYRALKAREIAGAALDVFEQEPIDKDDPILSLDNVVLTPHIGSASIETRIRMAEMAVENMIAALDDRVPANLVNKDVLV